MSDELMPVRCGCGGEAKVYKNIFVQNPEAHIYVCCEECLTRTSYFPTEAEAVEAWNRAMGATDTNVGNNERRTMVWKTAEGRPIYEKGVCSCGYVLSVLQRDYVYCPMCGAKLEWGALG